MNHLLSVGESCRVQCELTQSSGRIETVPASQLETQRQQGIRDAESEYLDLMQDEDDAMGAIMGASIT